MLGRTSGQKNVISWIRKKSVINKMFTELFEDVCVLIRTDDQGDRRGVQSLYRTLPKAMFWPIVWWMNHDGMESVFPHRDVSCVCLFVAREFEQ